MTSKRRLRRRGCTGKVAHADEEMAIRVAGYIHKPSTAAYQCVPTNARFVASGTSVGQAAEIYKASEQNKGRHEMLDSKASTPQPPPVAGQIDVAPVVIADIEARVAAGKRKYGTLLQTNNGRDALWDLYQELIDAVMYIRQRLLEEEMQPAPAPVVPKPENPCADHVTAFSCWLTKDGKFDASQTYVHADLPMRPDLAVAELRRGKVVVIGIGDLDHVRAKIEENPQ